MVKDKKKDKSALKAKKAEKTAKKSAKTEKKLSKKAQADDSDAENDVDLDAILAEYQKKQEQFLKVTEEPSEPPSPRSSATLIASPSNGNEVFLFGGEHYNGALATFFNDLYVYKINQDAWRKVTSPNSPLPRSGHAMCQGGNGGGIYLFGGEFSSPKQGTFYHYNDFWRLDPSTREWTKLEGKGGPPARSGHRMTYFKVRIFHNHFVRKTTRRRSHIIYSRASSSCSAASKTRASRRDICKICGSMTRSDSHGTLQRYRPRRENQMPARHSHSSRMKPERCSLGGTRA
jgi:hypothetical protein